MRPLSLILPILLVSALAGCLADAAVLVEEPLPCACVSDRDCPGGAICEVAADGCGTCRGIACVVDGDCSVGEVCDPARGLCERPLGCDGGAPDDGCGPTEQCLVLDVAGCRAPPLGDTCSLWPPSRTLLAGPLAVSAVGRAADGRIVPASRAIFTVSGAAAVAGTDDRDSVVLDVACPGPERCVVDVAASVGAARCAARYVVLPAAGDGDVRLIVSDADLGGPVRGAEVVVAADGSVVGGVTDDDGVFVAPGIGPQGGAAGFVAERITITAPGFTGFSCLGCDVDLEVALPRRVSRAGTPAVAGRVDVGGPVVGDLVFGLAGLPLAAPSFAALSLFGAPGTIPIDIEGITSPGDRLAFASAASLQLGTTAIRDDVVAFGRPGARSLWAFGAHLPIAAIAGILPREGAPPRDLRLETLRVASVRARTGLVGAVVPMPAGVPEGQRAALEELAGPGDALVLADVDVAADLDVTLSGPLPPRTSDVIVVVGAVLPGEGLIPLGGAVLSTRDETNDTRGVLPATTRIPFSPPHDGLEGRALRVVAIAVDVDALIADDVLGQARVVLDVGAPAPGRALAVTVPAFPAPPTARVVGNALLVDDAGDTTALRLHLRADDGDDAHIIELAGVAGAVSVADVLGDLEDLDVDLELEGAVVGGIDRRFAPSRGAWDEVLEVTTPR